MSHCPTELLAETKESTEADEREWMERYSRQIILPGVGGRGQRTLNQATVALFGCGPMAIPLALYLAGAGVGRLLVLASSGSDWLCAMVRDLNPQVTTVALAPPASLEEATALLLAVQMTVLAEGKTSLRELLNQAAFTVKRPLLAGWQQPEALLAAGAAADSASGAACLHCVAQSAQQHLQGRAAADPLLLHVARGAIGSLLAMETLRSLLGHSSALWHNCLLLLPEQSSYQSLAVQKISSCPVCASDR
ncbi:HesA/MoeB/ThiF family protein [Candidatus Magnetaquicoccus inordinatus]|uniref:HesA/MoeB/ThiF family protein n=1 Tax=Candidatus Magnetaquicoccus inordinatus TaxID=2496818 RepID=UPI00102CDBAD|nr:ThiF family adenylyltransferase [Candidatus Magnetaquicoccus inordinatus]